MDKSLPQIAVSDELIPFDFAYVLRWGRRGGKTKYYSRLGLFAAACCTPHAAEFRDHRAHSPHAHSRWWMLPVFTVLKALYRSPKRGGFCARSQVIYTYIMSGAHLGLANVVLQSLEEEEEAINALKIRLDRDNVTLPEDMVFAGDTDATLLRFIRARKLNIDDTAKMISGAQHTQRLQSTHLQHCCVGKTSQFHLLVIQFYSLASRALKIVFDGDKRRVYGSC
jgi:hypothetical protein